MRPQLHRGLRSLLALPAALVCAAALGPLSCSGGSASDDGDDDDGAPEGAAEGDCIDRIDNDDDGRIDCADSGCSSTPACDGGGSDGADGSDGSDGTDGADGGSDGSDGSDGTDPTDSWAGEWDGHLTYTATLETFGEGVGSSSLDVTIDASGDISGYGYTYASGLPIVGELPTQFDGHISEGGSLDGTLTIDPSGEFFGMPLPMDVSGGASSSNHIEGSFEEAFTVVELSLEYEGVLVFTR